ncbi:MULTISPECIES: YtxH domain-containing protein [Sorangium]|uniref:Membrane protein n=1 Tax=Sorangium cellulosum (strain So ce56) TaxID=448385 RepID=A9G463_SORC5|nr:YtxH domain-containing protein [Sorangium cellulosum]CAN98872.1 putative membrane protein [Sorangium cellulosum So ce56]
MKADDLVHYMADMFPYRKRSSLDWIVPLSLGLGLGVAMGVGVGVLVAPTSGDEARRRLRDSTSRLRERAERAKERALGAAQRTQDQIQEKLQESTGSYSNELGAR